MITIVKYDVSDEDTALIYCGTVHDKEEAASIIERDLHTELSQYEGELTVNDVRGDGTDIDVTDETGHTRVRYVMFGNDLPNVVIL
jgi:hypothetical protein